MEELVSVKSSLKNERGQAAIEFMIIVGVVLFFSVVFIGVLQSQNSDKIKERRSFEVNEVALAVRSEVALAVDASDGYQRHFDLPVTVAQQEYSVSINEGLVYVVTEDEKNAVSYPVADVIGQPQRGNNVIRRVGDLIYLNE